MASLWQTVVFRVYDTHNRQFDQSRHKWVGTLGDDEQDMRLQLWVTGFVAFDSYKSMLADAEGNVSGPANVIAGFGAGCTESLFAVTPFESIKTQL
jgi:hypothetical protein